jgi:polyhydroxybutyrate depolymerase
MTKSKEVNMKLRFRILLAAVMLAALGYTTAAQPCEFAAAGHVTASSLPKHMTCTVGGEKREALVYAPSITLKDGKLPLVFAFHGHGGNMQGASQQMHIQTVWPGAIVVYPQGLKGRPSPVDPQGLKPGWQVEANQANVGNKDLEYFDAMVETLRQKYAVDDTRIYSTGFSNGGTFSYLLWAERAQTLAAIGEVAGRLWDSEHLTQPRAALAIAGQADTTDPFALQQQTIEKARQADNATAPGQQCAVPGGAQSGTQCTHYSSTTHTPVKTLIHPGAHVYPSWAPQEIVDFFKAHHL